jgi:hypothetical protein
MRAYKFLSCKFGLKALREQRLKISEVRYLNDPFELLPFDISDPMIRKGVLTIRNEMGSGYGLLCFSRNWHNPVLWAHYAESHRGLCLGFEVPHDDQHAVAYVERPIKLERLDRDFANSMLFTKYEHWRYEEEIRMWATLAERSGSFYFCGFGPKLRLVEIIAGAGCPLSRRKLLQTLGSHQDGIRIVKARPAFDAFRVVEDENGVE